MIAIIVPVFKRFAVSRGLFECLLNVEDILVIVVDDGCQYEYKAFCEENDFVYIEGTGYLFWGGMINAGLEYLELNRPKNLERVIFANDDILINKSTLKKLISFDLDIVHPVVLDENCRAVESGSRLRSRYFLFTHHPFRGLHKHTIPKNRLERIDVFTARFLVMKPEIIERLKGVRTEHFLHYGGDSDFGLRTRGLFKAFVSSNTFITLNTLTTSNSLKLDVNFLVFTKSLFEFKSALNLVNKARLINLHLPVISRPFNLLLLIPFSYCQYFYYRWIK